MRLPEIKPHKKYRYDEIIEALARSARLYGVKLLAAQMGVDERYLQSKLTVSHSSSAHYLRADEMISVMLITGDWTALHMLADLFDHLLIPRQAAQTAPTREDLSYQIMAECGLLVKHLAEALEDRTITDEEWNEVAPVLKSFELKLADANRRK